MKDAVVGGDNRRAALANAQIYALLTDVHYAGKYYYEEKEKQNREKRYERPRMDDFAPQYMNTSRV